MAELETSRLFRIVDISVDKSWDEKEETRSPVVPVSGPSLSFLLESFQTVKQAEHWFLTGECQA